MCAAKDRSSRTPEYPSFPAFGNQDLCRKSGTTGVTSLILIVSAQATPLRQHDDDRSGQDDLRIVKATQEEQHTAHRYYELNFQT